LKAGVFDSGVGGLSVLSSLLEHNLFSEIIYYGDTARVPYGTKNPKTIIKYALEALDFFEQFNIDVLIFACNSVSAYAIDIIQSKTNLKVFGVIKAGILATNKIANKNDNILIIGTQATIDSNRYHNELSSLGYRNLNSIATPLFVPLIEEGIFSGDILDLAMKKYFDNIKKPDIVILGCTHYPFISDAISSYFDNICTIHSGESIAEYLHTKLDIKSNFDIQKVQFFASDGIEKLEKITLKWMDNKYHKYFIFYKEK
jgi:glutamate racemase